MRHVSQVVVAIALVLLASLAQGQAANSTSKAPPPSPKAQPTCTPVSPSKGVSVSYYLKGKKLSAQQVSKGLLPPQTLVVQACATPGWRLFVGSTQVGSGTYNRTCAATASTGSRWLPKAQGSVTCKPPAPPPPRRSPPPPPASRCGAKETFCGAKNDTTWFNCCSADQTCYAPARRCCDNSGDSNTCSFTGETASCACDEACIVSMDGASCYPAGSFLCGSGGICSDGQLCDNNGYCGEGLCCDAGQVLCGDRCCDHGWTCTIKDLGSTYPCTQGTCTPPKPNKRPPPPAKG